MFGLKQMVRAGKLTPKVALLDLTDRAAENGESAIVARSHTFRWLQNKVNAAEIAKKAQKKLKSSVDKRSEVS